MKFIKGARTWRSILGTQTFFWPLTPPPPRYSINQPLSKGLLSTRWFGGEEGGFKPKLQEAGSLLGDPTAGQNCFYYVTVERLSRYSQVLLLPLGVPPAPAPAMLHTKTFARSRSSEGAHHQLMCTHRARGLRITTCSPSVRSRLRYFARRFRDSPPMQCVCPTGGGGGSRYLNVALLKKQHTVSWSLDQGRRGGGYSGIG